jgi:hypothetical protein
MKTTKRPAVQALPDNAEFEETLVNKDSLEKRCYEMAATGGKRSVQHRHRINDCA